MTASLGGLAAMALGSLAIAVLLFFPGFRLARRLAGAEDDRVLAVLSVLVSVLLMAVLTAALLLLHRFDARIVAAVAVVATVLNLRSVVDWLRGVPRGYLIALMATLVLAVPWILSASRGDDAPANTLQWYYWDLGRALSFAGAIPASVNEYGSAIRWLPDYLYFNGISEAYGSLMAVLAPAVAMAAWRVPIAIMGFGAIYLVARLWLRPPAAYVAMAATGASFFFLTKFNTYKPESLGIVLGLLAAWLIVTGLRSSRPSWLVVGGLALGVDVSVHAIAAAVIGLLLGGACLAELATGQNRRRLFAGAVAAAGAAFVVVVTTGVALQGRAFVVADAFHPIAGATDPTWTYLQYSSGIFTQTPVPPLTQRLATGVTQPWPGISIAGPNAIIVVGLLGLGLVLAVFLGTFSTRRGVLTGLLAALGLGLGVAYFAFAFATYVPEHTGLTRFAQYAPLLMALGVGFAFEGYQAAWERISGELSQARLVLAVGIVAALWLVPLAQDQFASAVGISSDGLTAIAALQARLSPGDVVLTNAVTTGMVEFFTTAEVPLEGRQPLIEEPALLMRANDLLLAGHRFFGPEQDEAILQTLNVRWVLVVDRPETLGATVSLGGSVDNASRLPNLSAVWRGQGAAIYQVSPSAAAVEDGPRTMVSELLSSRSDQPW